jgi:FixJ family two-component response regulator
MATHSPPAALRLISLIDDDDGVREGTANLLRSLGYDVRTFQSAQDFLDWLGLDDTVSCVITDIMMPGIDGFDLYRRLVVGGHRFPIIFMTALANPGDQARMKECRVHSILTKPCSERSLMDCVESALSGKPRASSPGNASL